MSSYVYRIPRVSVPGDLKYGVFVQTLRVYVKMLWAKLLINHYSERKLYERRNEE